MIISKEELERKYNDLTVKQLCDELEVTPPTLFKYLRKLDISFKGRGKKAKIEIV